MPARQNNRRHAARFDVAKWARSMTLDMLTKYKKPFFISTFFLFSVYGWLVFDALHFARHFGISASRHCFLALSCRCFTVLFFCFFHAQIAFSSKAKCSLSPPLLLLLMNWLSDILTSVCLPACLPACLYRCCIFKSE